MSKHQYGDGRPYVPEGCGVITSVHGDGSLTYTVTKDDGTTGRAIVRGIQSLRERARDFERIVQFQSYAGYRMLQATKRRTRLRYLSQRLAEYAYGRG